MTRETEERVLNVAIFVTKKVGLAAGFVATRCYKAAITLLELRAALRGEELTDADR